MNEITTLNLLGRSKPLFDSDLNTRSSLISDFVANGKFLVIGGAGTIGSAVVKQLFKRNPKVLHVVDISENNLAEVVRDIRSSEGYIDGDFRTFCIDCRGSEFDAFASANKDYDYVLNFSALKHVRSEKDPFTLMRLVQTNVFATKKTLEFAEHCQAKKYFCVSTDKASNPVNMMGASKRIMEMFLLQRQNTPVSSARFANVAFSDGSLLHSYRNRIAKNQPLVAPTDVKRYFVTDTEGALLCLFSIFFGDDRDIFFPKLTPELNLETFKNIAIRYLESLGFEPHVCDSEDEARSTVNELKAQQKYPCYFFESDTTGEKDFEEFYTEKESVDWDSFKEIGIVKNDFSVPSEKLEAFETDINRLYKLGTWNKKEILDSFFGLLPEFVHEEKNRYLDDKM